MTKTARMFNLFEKYILYIFVLLFPIIVIPTLSVPFEFPKIILLYVTVLILLTTKIVKFFSNKDVRINVSNFDFFVVLIALSYLLSTIFAGVNKIEAFLIPGNAGFVILGTILYFMINQQSENEKYSLQSILIASIFISSVLSIIAFTGIASSLPINNIFKTKSFSTFGNIYTSIIMSLSILPILISRLFKNNDIYEKILSGLIAFILLISISVSVYTSIKDKEIFESILEYKYGTALAIDAFKENILFGSGPTNFGYIFNKYRPVDYNSDPQWNLKYIQSSSQALTTITETALLGLISFIYLFYLLYKNKNFYDTRYISILIITLGITLLPLSTSIYILLYIGMSIYSKNKSVDLVFFENNIVKYTFAIPCTLFVITTSYLVYRGFYAEYLYSKAISYASKNEAIKAYESTNNAIKQNRYLDKYHLLSASININLADALAKKTNISNEDRETISKLIQQSIREVKLSVAANPKKSSNWESMSDLYRIIMSFAKGAEAFSIESLKQSISLDPINPILRVKLGGLLYSLKKYDEAIESNRLAVLAKPDFANAHYNLALSYRANNNLENAKDSINNVLKLVGKDGTAYETALKELKQIESLTTPEEKINQNIEPRIELPEEKQ